MTTRPSRKAPNSSSLLAATQASSARTRSSSRLTKAKTDVLLETCAKSDSATPPNGKLDASASPDSSLVPGEGATFLESDDSNQVATVAVETKGKTRASSGLQPASFAAKLITL